MKLLEFARYLYPLLLAPAILFNAGFVLSQEQGRAVVPVEAPAAAIGRLQLCPAPISLTLTAATPNVVKGDFTAAQLSNYQTSLNYSGTDKQYLHTFEWKRQHRCCQITKAVLTVRVKALLNGQSNSSSDAGNDGIALMHLGAWCRLTAKGCTAVGRSLPGNWPPRTGI